MEVSSSFLHFEHTPALDLKIVEASAKMSKFFHDTGNLKWSCYVKNNEHCAEVNYLVPHYEYHGKGVSDNMYESIDIAIAKIEKQALKQKERFNKLHLSKKSMIAIGFE
jgi:putative sigma-54 modulation protein